MVDTNIKKLIGDCKKDISGELSYTHRFVAKGVP
jgi:hypothetical protein